MGFSILEEGTDSQKKFILRDDQTGTTAEIFCFGGLLNALNVETTEGWLNVIDGFKDVNDAKTNMNNGFKSAKLSPFVCRMNNGEYRFEGTDYKVDDYYLGKHAIHGLLCHAQFTVLDKGSNHEKAWVQLGHQYQATDKGYPFAYSLSVTWTLHANHCITVTTVAMNQHHKSIPFADGWHPYFSTDTGVDESTLRFNTNRKLVFNDELMPTGAEEKDERFLAGSLLSGIELDNCFILPSDEKSICLLKGKKVSISIEPDAAYPYLQIYTPPHRKSIAIENLTAAPDAFNNKMGLQILQPGKTISCTTTYRVELL